MILTYELSDDPGVEHEVEVESVEAAAKIISDRSDYIVWFEVVDDEGNEVDFTFYY